jgi:Ca2+-binding EF-hand superfamily protein
MKEADANGDGKISKDEAPPMLKDRFDRLDANSDGFLDDTEIREMFRRMSSEGGKTRPRTDSDNK